MGAGNRRSGGGENGIGGEGREEAQESLGLRRRLRGAYRRAGGSNRRW